VVESQPCAATVRLGTWLLPHVRSHAPRCDWSTNSPRPVPSGAIARRSKATFELLTSPSLRLVAKVPFAAAPAAC
jgi:hypothetical protein